MHRCVLHKTIRPAAPLSLLVYILCISTSHAPHPITPPHPITLFAAADNDICLTRLFD